MPSRLTACCLITGVLMTACGPAEPRPDAAARLDGAAVAYVELVLGLIRRHMEYTGSTVAARVLDDWDRASRQFVKVMPRDYKRVLMAQARAAAAGRDASFHELVGVAVNG